MSDSSPNGNGEAIRLPSIYKLMSDIAPTYEALGSLKDSLKENSDAKYNSSAHSMDDSQGNGRVAFNNSDLHSRFGKSELDQRSGIFGPKDMDNNQNPSTNSLSSRGSDDSSEPSKSESDSPSDEASSQTRLDENGNKRTKDQRDPEPLARFQRSQISRRSPEKRPMYSEYEYKQGDPRLQPFMGQGGNESGEGAGATGPSSDLNSDNFIGTLSRTSSGLSSNSTNSSSNGGSSGRSSEESLSGSTDQSSRSSDSAQEKLHSVALKNGSSDRYRSSDNGTRPDKSMVKEEQTGGNEPPTKMQRLKGISDDRLRHDLRDPSKRSDQQNGMQAETNNSRPSKNSGSQPSSSTSIGKRAIGALQPLEPHPKVQDEVKYSNIPVYSFMKSEPAVSLPQPSTHPNEMKHSNLPGVPMVPQLQSPKFPMANSAQSSIPQDPRIPPAQVTSPSHPTYSLPTAYNMANSLYPQPNNHGLYHPSSFPQNDTKSQQPQSHSLVSSISNGAPVHLPDSNPMMYNGQYNSSYFRNAMPFMPQMHGMNGLEGVNPFVAHQAAYDTPRHPGLVPQQQIPSQLAQAPPHQLQMYLARSLPEQQSQPSQPMYDHPPSSMMPSSTVTSHQNGPPQNSEPLVRRTVSVHNSNGRHPSSKMGSSRPGNDSGTGQQPEFHIIDSNTGKHLVAEGPKRRGNLPKDVTSILRNWLTSHLGNPYPTEDDKMALVAQTGLSMVQVSNWFINARRRSIPASQRRGKSHIYGPTRRESNGLKRPGNKGKGRGKNDLAGDDDSS